MLSLFFIHLFITFSCLFSGFFVYTYVLKNIEQEENEYKPIIFYLITGLITITLLSQIAILFIPLNDYSKYVFIIVIALLTIVNKKKAAAFVKHISKKITGSSLIIRAAVIITWGLILVNNAGPTQMDDTESYHIQMIKWIQEYGTVPGIANLHERFGFNSSWFSSIAFFNFSFNQINYFTALNAVIAVWFTAYLFSKIKKNQIIAPAVSIASLAVLILSLVCWPLIRGNAATCNYDFITTVIVFVLFFETFLSSTTFRNYQVTYEWVIWPVYLFTVRILNFPFLILSIPILFILLKQKKLQNFFTLVIFCILLVAPFFVRNVILSGYMFFPSMSFDWFAVDWKVGAEKIEDLLHYIKYYNRVGTAFQDINITESIKFPQWIVPWYHFMFSYDKLLIIPGIGGMLLAPLLRKKITPVPIFYRNIFFLALIIQLISWFFIAPDPRFIYGCLLIGILIFVVFLSRSYIKELWKKNCDIALISTIGAILFFTLLKIFDERKENWILPLNLPQPQIKNVTIGNIEIHIPEKIFNNWNPRCFATPLPCAYKIDPGLEPRGTTIAHGFRIRK